MRHRHEDLGLRAPGIAVDHQPEPWRELDALVPRDGVKPGLAARVTPEEYLARLTSVARKVRGVEHRATAWAAIAAKERARFESFAASVPQSAEEALRGLPDGAVVELRLSTNDVRLENEFEAFLFSTRSALDMLARFIAAHLPGSEDIHSFHRLHAQLQQVRTAGSPLAQAVRSAWENWAEDLTERRDAAGHYIALRVHSERRRSALTGASESVASATIGIPVMPDRRSIPVWWADLPIGTQRTSSAVESGGEKAEAHGLFDNDGRLILRHNGPLPDEPPLQSAEDYVRTRAEWFRAHVDEIFRLLASANCLAPDPVSPPAP